MAIKSCPICGTPARQRMSVSTPYLERRQRYDVLSCPECRHIWCLGDTSAALLHRIYSESFHNTSQQLAKEHARKEDKHSPIVQNAAWRAEWLCGLGLVGTLLDVGAGNGYFVREVSNAGFTAEGIDLSADAAATAASIGVAVRTGDFLATDFLRHSYDVVTMWDVLCGFPDTHSVVAQVRELLTPEGMFIFTVAEGSSWMARWCGRFWPLLIPPVNLHYFSPESIERLLEQHGMAMVRYEYQGKWLSVRFLWQKALRTLHISPLETAIANHIPLQWRVRLNLRDIATVVARPRPS